VAARKKAAADAAKKQADKDKVESKVKDKVEGWIVVGAERILLAAVIERIFPGATNYF